MNFSYHLLLLFSLVYLPTYARLTVKCGSAKIENPLHRDLVRDVLSKISVKIGRWVKGQSPLYFKYNNNQSFYSKGACTVVSNDKCDECIRNLVNRSSTLCSNTAVGYIAVENCKIRWSNYSFNDFPNEERIPSKVECSPEKLQPDQGHFFDVLGSTFNQLTSNSHKWDPNTLYTYVSSDAMFIVKGKCFRQTQNQCQTCAEGIVNQSWERCGNAVSGSISNEDCSVEWAKTQ